VSYDLEFRFNRPDRGAEPQDFLDYFRGCANYEVSESQAWYSNEITGVYFCFDIGHLEPDPEAPPRAPNTAPIAFNLNYFRPHTFGLEAEPEVAALVNKFDLSVSDPQVSGMGEGPFDAEGFLRGWNAGNLLGYRVALQDQPISAFRSMSAADLESIWRWNFTREQRQAEVGDSVYVPRVFIFELAGQLHTGIAWADAVPILLPVVGLILVPRDRLAPRRGLRKSKDIALLRWSEVERIVRQFPRSLQHLPAHMLDYVEAPKDLEQLVRSKETNAEKVTGVNPGEVLDRELFLTAAKPSA
jgi:hypothetical protein